MLHANSGETFQNIGKIFPSIKNNCGVSCKTLQPNWSKDGNTGEQHPCQELHVKDSQIPWVKTAEQINVSIFNAAICKELLVSHIHTAQNIQNYSVLQTLRITDC